MRYLYLLLFIGFSFLACQPRPVTTIPPWTPYDESIQLAENATHESPRMQYQLIQSKVLDKNDIWKNVADQISDFSEEDYQRLKPLIFEQDIPTIQAHIADGQLNYKQLTQWYLYRIVHFENDSTKTLHTVMAINPNAVIEARERDKNRNSDQHPIYGMPILLKDNIGVIGMPTSAGAIAMMENTPGDAFIVERLKEKGAIILGKVNLSEWAYFICDGCPLGYSGVGGQTLNPYGPRRLETGGSSAGSGTAMAANYAVAAVGTETSGSILSPSSLNSVVGLKPTIGLLSRGGIVPISSTLDTPGPMTRNVTDNAILLSAMTGEDPADPATKDNPKQEDYWGDIASGSLAGMRFGVNKSFLDDSIYSLTVQKIRDLGAETIEFEPLAMEFEGFLTLLSADMKADLPVYLETYASKNIPYRTVADIVAFNREDTTLRVPYGQSLFEGIVADTTSPEALAQIKERLRADARKFLETPMQEYQLDAILSINNWNAGHAALAQYPCLTVPMGYKASGEPVSLTFIARPFEEGKLLKMGYAFEQATKVRKVPEGYE
jgi:amidase